MAFCFLGSPRIAGIDSWHSAAPACLAGFPALTAQRRRAAIQAPQIRIKRLADVVAAQRPQGWRSLQCPPVPARRAARCADHLECQARVSGVELLTTNTMLEHSKWASRLWQRVCRQQEVTASALTSRSLVIPPARRLRPVQLRQ
jgi:hypothetical protein